MLFEIRCGNKKSVAFQRRPLTHRRGVGGELKVHACACLADGDSLGGEPVPCIQHQAEVFQKGWIERKRSRVGERDKKGGRR